MAEKSRRELLEEAFDAAENEDADQPSGEARADASEAEQRQASDTGAPADSEQTPEGEDAGERQAGDEAGAGEKVGEKPADKPVKEKKPETPDSKERRAAAEAGRRAAPVTDRAPNSWKPGAREEWGKIPAGARAEITRREQEIQRELSQTGLIRKFSNDLARVIEPHLPIMRAQNTTPMTAINNLLSTASRLYQGSQEQKAQIVSEIMRTYGVDVRVLDKVLSGQPLPPSITGQQLNNGAVPDWARPIFSFMTQAEAARAQRATDMQAEADAEIAGAQDSMPFLNDLREDVADILEAAAKRGRVLTLADAYKRAVQLDPEVSQIVSQREAAAKQRQNGGGKLAQARRAASTISGGPRGNVAAGGGRGNAKPSRREVIAEAWDSAET